MLYTCRNVAASHGDCLYDESELVAGVWLEVRGELDAAHAVLGDADYIYARLPRKRSAQDLAKQGFVVDDYHSIGAHVTIPSLNSSLDSA